MPEFIYPVMEFVLDLNRLSFLWLYLSSQVKIAMKNMKRTCTCMTIDPLFDETWKVCVYIDYDSVNWPIQNRMDNTFVGNLFKDRKFVYNSTGSIDSGLATGLFHVSV